jgi:hypothetical protein
MGLREDGEAGKISPGDLQLGQATGSICSLNEAWFLIGTGSPPFERAPQRRRCFDGEANSPHA